MLGVDDLTTLATLDEEQMLEHLRSRYCGDSMKIYTNVGDILVAFNPFEELDIYGVETGRRYFRVSAQYGYGCVIVCGIRA